MPIRGRKATKYGFGLLILSLALLLGAVAGVRAADDGIAAGREAFRRNCAVCHGTEGDAKGQVCFVRSVERSGRVMDTYPRDLTVGVFKFRTTPTGCLPTDEDILKIVTDGIPKSSMPTFRDMPLEQRKAIVSYVKTLSERWEEEEPCEGITVKRPEWVGSPASVQRGREVYKDMKCWECHGYEGKGDGPKSAKLKDDWQRPIVPFDFTTGELKRETSPESIYITFTTGLDGTGMPSYAESLNEEDRWHLVSYTLELMGYKAGR